MRSNRLALLAVTAGSVLLGWSTAGVGAVARGLPSPAATTPAGAPAHHGEHEHRGADHDGPRL